MVGKRLIHTKHLSGWIHPKKSIYPRMNINDTYEGVYPLLLSTVGLPCGQRHTRVQLSFGGSEHHYLLR